MKMVPRASLLFVMMLVSRVAGQSLSCGQTGECISIVVEVSRDFLPPLEAQQPKTKQRQKFQIITDGSGWRIRILEADPPMHAGFLRQEFGSDGESVYAVTTFETNFMSGVGGGRVKNNGSATVLPGRIPMPSFSIEYVWMAYLSGCELKQLEAGSIFELPPLFSVALKENHHMSFKEPARWTLSKNFPFSPSRLEFFGDGTYGWTPQGVQRFSSRPYTNLALSVEGTTNSGAWTVPAKFSSAVYGPPAGSWISSTVKGVTKEISRIPRPFSFLPAVPSSTHVLDWRFEPVKSYSASNKWFSLDEIRERR
jgi:hypothetical protein